jgi:nicotinamidase-related amidase
MVNPALIIIDVQKGIDEAIHWGGNRNNPEAEGNIKVLLTQWRSTKLPVFIVKHDSKYSGSPFFPGKAGNDLKDFASALDGEVLIAKSTANAFVGTPLLAGLKERKVSKVFIAGFVTNNSVEATARMSGDLGFDTTVVSDATAAFNMTGLDGTVYSSELVHQISLSNLKGEYAEIQTTQQILTYIQQLI